MNQLELNAIAKHFIQNQSIEVAKKLKGLLSEDLKEKEEEMPGLTAHYIHNMALFETLLFINCFIVHNNNSEEVIRQYLEHAETLKPKFLDIVDSLKDFKAISEDQEEK